MVSFIRKVLVWIAALVVAMALTLFLGIALIGFFVGLAQPAPIAVKDGSILVLDLDLNIPDSPEADDPLKNIGALLSGGTSTVQMPLLRLIQGLEEAAEDSRIQGVLLQGNLIREGYGTSLAALQEVRGALEAVKKAGKPIWAYVDVDNAADFYVKSVADNVIMHPLGEVRFSGLGLDRLYFGDFFARIGITPLVIAREEYKTMAEPFVSNQMSEPEREQTEAMMGTLWNQLVSEVAESRALEIEEVERLSNEVGFLNATVLLEAGWIDTVAHVDEVLDRFTELAGFDPETDGFTRVGFLDYLAASAPLSPFIPGNKDTVSVIYAEGIIVDGEGDVGQVGGDRIARLLRNARRDESVKAVVLRVNSPGGSATASEKILREVARTNDEKPVIVSMGGVAASGGYWISTLADTIFVSNSTITGSIGVAFILPVAEGLLDHLSIRTERLATGPLANTLSLSRTKTEAELDLLHTWIDRAYEAFLVRVGEGRGMDPARARELARGRVWMGEAAVANGLADRIGTLEDAIAYAAERAGVGTNYIIDEQPRSRTFEDIIASFLSSPSVLLQAPLFSGGHPVMRELRMIEKQLGVLLELNDPRGLHAIDLRFLRID